MPTYVYRREDGSTFEVEQRITADPLEVCPNTRQRVERVITGAGLIFKGSGFYLTDYARKAESTASTSDSNAAKDTTAATASSEKTTASETKSSSNGTSESSSKSSTSE